MYRDPTLDPPALVCNAGGTELRYHISAPEDLAASFKLYRNLDALYDVFGQVVEAAGAFGSKDEYQNLSNDMSALQSARLRRWWRQLPAAKCWMVWRRS